MKNLFEIPINNEDSYEFKLSRKDSIQSTD